VRKYAFAVAIGCKADIAFCSAYVTQSGHGGVIGTYVKLSIAADSPADGSTNPAPPQTESGEAL
jgi:hypothetical protein